MSAPLLTELENKNARRPINVALLAELRALRSDGEWDMAVAKIEQRLAALEAEVAELKRRLEQPAELKPH